MDDWNSPPRRRSETMNKTEALRFLEHEARRCLEKRYAGTGDPDAGEILCLVPPSLCRVFHLPEMTDAEADQFRENFRRLLKEDFRFDRDPSRVGCGGRT